MAGRRADVGGRRNWGEINLQVPIVADGVAEAVEAFTLELVSPTGGAALGDTTQATVQINVPPTPPSAPAACPAAAVAAVTSAGSAQCCSGWAARCGVDGFGTASVLVRLKWADGFPICPSRRSRLLRQAGPHVRHRSRCSRRDSLCAAVLLSRGWRRRSARAGGHPRAGTWRSALRLPDVPGCRKPCPWRLSPVRHGARARRAGGNGR